MICLSILLLLLIGSWESYGFIWSLKNTQRDYVNRLVLVIIETRNNLYTVSFKHSDDEILVPHTYWTGAWMVNDQLKQLWSQWDSVCFTWWRHQMEIYSELLALCSGNSSVPIEFPSQRLVTRSFDVSLICTWPNGCVNNRNDGDLRRHRAHYDVNVVIQAMVF